MIILRAAALSEIIARYCSVTTGIVLTYFPASWLSYNCILFFFNIWPIWLSILLLSLLVVFVTYLREMSVNDDL